MDLRLFLSVAIPPFLVTRLSLRHSRADVYIAAVAKHFINHLVVFISRQWVFRIVQVFVP